MNTETAAKRRLMTRIVFVTLPLCAACFYAGRLSVTAGHKSATPETSPATMASVSDHQPLPAPSAEPVRAGPSNTAPFTNRWDEARWQQLISQPGTAARNAALAALLEALATTDPQRAIALAQAEGNLNLREELLHAALRGWGRTGAGDAAAWALSLGDPSERSAAMAAVFAGAVATNPDEAMRVGRDICRDNPGEAVVTGSLLIDAFCDNGNFAAAVQLAADGEGTAQRSIWMAEAYSRWATLQPQQAAEAANVITDPALRNEALHGVVGGWAGSDPAGLTQFLTQLPAGGDRASMLGQALQSWARLDPEAAANWINTREASPDYDEGVAAVAGSSFVKTDVALGWAESIGDAKLRSETLANVLHNWVLEDLPAAKQYFDTTKDLLPEDRQQISEIIASAEAGE
jgi:hypothetical protein